jgi:hypothetical protein
MLTPMSDILAKKRSRKKRDPQREFLAWRRARRILDARPLPPYNFGAEYDRLTDLIAELERGPFTGDVLVPYRRY